MGPGQSIAAHIPLHYIDVLSITLDGFLNRGCLILSDHVGIPAIYSLALWNHRVSIFNDWYVDCVWEKEFP